jgi:HK97 family phage major capsid protein
MDEIKKLIEAMGRAFEEFKAQNDSRIKAIESRGYAPADLAEKVERINADISNIAEMKRQLEAIETAVARQQFGSGGQGQGPEAANRLRAFNHLMRRGAENIKELEVQAAASTLSDPDGGFTVPEEVDAAIDRVAATMSAMRSLATVMSISTDTYKKLVSQGGTVSGWTAEKGTRAEAATPTLSEIAINTKEIYAMPYATQTLLDDSRVDIGAWLAGEVAIEFTEEEGDAFVNGNGVEKPHGIAGYTMVANASYAWGKVGYIAGGHGTLLNNLDKLIDVQHALKPVYRNGASWLMNDATVGVVRKFKDGDGNYIWRPGLLEGAPDTLLSKPVVVDDNVDDIGSNKYPIFYGNFKRAYLIIDRLGTRVLRDPYTAKPYVAFYTTKRVGGGIVMYEALKALKITG